MSTNIGNGTLGALNEVVDLLDVGAFGTGGVIISGTWVGTIAFQCTIERTATPLAIMVQSLGGGLATASTTSNGQYIFNLAGIDLIRFKMAAYTSGTATISAYGSEKSVFNRGITVISGGTDASLIGNRSNRLLVDPELSTSFLNIVGNATTTVKSGAGTIQTLLIADNTTGGTVVGYDNTAGSGTKLFTIQVGSPSGGLLSTSGQPGPVSLPLGYAFSTGLTIVTSGSSSNNITVGYK